MKQIFLSDRFPEFVASVSDEDYSFLVRWRWTFKRSTRKHDGYIYACRNTWTGSVKTGDFRRVKIMMHNVVLERSGWPRPSESHTAHHKNSVTLDNQRHNLEWQDRSGQNKAAWKNRKKKK